MKKRTKVKLKMIRKTTLKLKTSKEMEKLTARVLTVLGSPDEIFSKEGQPEKLNKFTYVL